ncbi:unnamed protein product [Brassica napus]|uniref:Uncharacterized protein n=2 Tax=Brassica TaxID=3705 RepID=A0A0D2ZTZ1_BRAOL|nr:unnamed protein product [Brassica napus]
MATTKVQRIMTQPIGLCLDACISYIDEKVARWNKVTEKYKKVAFVLDLDDRFGYVSMPSLGHKNFSQAVNIHDRDTIAYTGIVGIMDHWKLDWDEVVIPLSEGL